MTTIPITTNYSFLRSIVQIRGNRDYLLLGLGISILSFVLFKLLYPYPDFFSDSYSYIFAAYAHLDVSIWPIGYSKFLAAFHTLTYSDTAIVCFQFFFLQLSLLYLFFSILYFFNPSKIIQFILFLILLLNPLTLYISNTINSDALFGALSIIWFTQLIWVLKNQEPFYVFLQAITLFLCFTVRNNAYYYPVVAIFAILTSTKKNTIKIAGIILPLILVISFILYSRNKAYEFTGIKAFSLFTGWQLANNALYIYDKINLDSNEIKNKDIQAVNREAVSFFKQIDLKIYRPFIESYVGNFFIRENQAPLKTYYRNHFKIANEYQTIINWSQSSEVFEKFGKYIILKYPFKYVRYFVLPNILHYFNPPLSHLEIYNYGNNYIEPIAQYWFHYTSNKINCFSKTFQGYLLAIFPSIFLFVNTCLAILLLIIFLKKNYSHIKAHFYPIISLLLILFLCNFFFLHIFNSCNITISIFPSYNMHNLLITNV